MRRELGLVDSLDYLVQFGVTLLPVQVRLTPDKLTLLQKCLDAKPDAYRYVKANQGPLDCDEASVHGCDLLFIVY